MSEHFPDSFFIVIHNVSAESDDWFHNELDKHSLELRSIISIIFSLEFLGFLVIVVVTPKFLHHLVKVNLEFLTIDSGKLGQGEGPSEKSRSKGNSSLDWVNLLGVSHIFALIGSNNDIGIFNDSLEVLIHCFSINLKFQDTSIDLVNEEDRLDLFS